MTLALTSLTGQCDLQRDLLRKRLQQGDTAVLKSRSYGAVMNLEKIAAPTAIRSQAGCSSVKSERAMLRSKLYSTCSTARSEGGLANSEFGETDRLASARMRIGV